MYLVRALDCNWAQDRSKMQDDRSLGIVRVTHNSKGTVNQLETLPLSRLSSQTNPRRSSGFHAIQCDAVGKARTSTDR